MGLCALFIVGAIVAALACRVYHWAMPADQPATPISTPSAPYPVALITGSARRRLGWHIADALGRRGYRIVIHYNTSAKEAEQAASEFKGRGIEAISIGAD